jgi:hypothetical protein
METIAAMRADPGTAGAIGKLTDLCEETELGTYLVTASAGEAPPVGYGTRSPRRHEDLNPGVPGARGE